MKPRLSFITLAVDDLKRSLRFYRDGLEKRMNTGYYGNPAGDARLSCLTKAPRPGEG